MLRFPIPSRKAPPPQAERLVVTQSATRSTTRSVALAVSLFVAFVAAPAFAQHAGHPAAPYAGEQRREIKALSADEARALAAGAGAGYARAAELNHYPGPMHVVELADVLGLSTEQKRASEALLHAHKREARELGTAVVAAERELDRLFADGRVDAATLAAAVTQAGAAQSAYRLSHLDAHRRQRELLSAEQVAEYDRRRGYGVP
jgi:hypothetical protein